MEYIQCSPGLHQGIRMLSCTSHEGMRCGNVMSCWRQNQGQVKETLRKDKTGKILPRPDCIMVKCTDFGVPGSSVVKNLPANAGDAGLIPESGRSPGGGNGNPLQYSCLGNPMDGGAWWAAAAKSLQSCPTLCDPIDGSPPGSPVPGILQTTVCGVAKS